MFSSTVTNFPKRPESFGKKIHSLSSGLLTLFTRKKKGAKAGKKFAIFLLLCLFKYSCYLVMLYFHQKFHQLAKLQFLFKFIQESMQNNYQFSFKTRMVFFDDLRPCYVYLSLLCVINIVFFFFLKIEQVLMYLNFHMYVYVGLNMNCEPKYIYLSLLECQSHLKYQILTKCPK